MDDELHDLTPGAGHGLPDDDPAVRAFRSALGGGPRRTGDPRAVLAGIERRARTHQRRRLAGTTTLAVAALAVVVAVTPAVLGPRGTDTAVPAGPTTSAPAPDSGESVQILPQTAPAVTADSLVRPEDVTFLGEGVALDGDAVLATGEVPAAGVCVDTADGVSPTSSSVQGTFTAGAAEGGDQEVLMERVLRWDAQSEADSYLLAVAAQAATCSPTEVGLEGTGPWTVQDATAITPAGGQAQVYTAPFGGFTDVQVLLASGNTVIKLQALVAEADPVLAVEQLTATATAAGERAFADSGAPIATDGAPVEGGGAAPTAADVSAASLLTTDDVTPLGRDGVTTDVTTAAVPLDQQDPATALCPGADLAVALPASAWTASWTQVFPEGNTDSQGWVSEQVLRWSSAVDAEAYLRAQQEVGAVCWPDHASSGQGRELDASEIIPDGGGAVLHELGLYPAGTTVRSAVMTQGTTAVFLTAALDSSTSEQDFADLARTAANRAFTDIGGDGPTDDSLAAS